MAANTLINIIKENNLDSADLEEIGNLNNLLLVILQKIRYNEINNILTILIQPEVLISVIIQVNL